MYASSSHTAYSPDVSSDSRESALPLYLSDTDEKDFIRPVVGWGGIRSRRMRNMIAVFGLVFTGAVWSQMGSLSSPYGKEQVSFPDETDILPGIVIGEHGSYKPTPSPTKAQTKPPVPSTDVQKWGMDLSSKDLVSGLSPWPDNPPFENQEPLSPLGHFADQLYRYGPSTMRSYHDQLTQFIDIAFPESLRPELKASLDGYVSLDGISRTESWDTRRAIWQTDKDESKVNNNDVKSWKAGSAKDEGWKWEMVADEKADKYISKYLKDSRIEKLWQDLPSGILRSDMLRYLLLYLEGGIYTDTDTVLLKSPSHWGRTPNLWRNGAGWLDDDLLKRIEEGVPPENVLPLPSVIVGIEADVGGREDWHDWWPRPMQIVQWTMASAPSHPIALSALLRILHATATAVDWTHDHSAKIKTLNDNGDYDQSAELMDIDALSEPNKGGPVGVMDWTGPGIWTDAVLSYLKVKYGVVWTDLKNLREPLRIGDVVILPVTGFSPGVGNFGAEDVWHHQAMVEHRFKGSWKAKEE